MSWKSNGGPIVGRLAFATDGTIFAAIGPGTATGDGKVNAIVALDPKTLQVKDWFTQPGAEFVTGPTVFKHNDRDIVAAATKDGRVLLLNAASLGGANHSTPLHASAPAIGASVAGNALATWQELTITPPPAPAAGHHDRGRHRRPAPRRHRRRQPSPTARAGSSRPTANGIVALKVGRDRRIADARARLGGAEPRGARKRRSSSTASCSRSSTGRPSTPAGRGTPAVLHAYEGTTGKAMWNSKTAMTTFASPGSFWSALSQIYVGTNDGTLHAFGFLDERR